MADATDRTDLEQRVTLLLGHIVERLPVGTKESEREAGWMALGWGSGAGDDSLPSPHSRTLRVLADLGGAARHRWGRIEGVDPAVAAVARAATRWV